MKFSSNYGGEQGIRTLDTRLAYTRFPIVLLRPARTALQLAPQVGFEPTTDRLTADSSTTELLRNNKTLFEFCLATSYSHKGKPLTTIGAEKLNFRVRDGNGCDLLAIIARQLI